MKRIIATAVLGLCLMGSGASAQEIRIGTAGGYMPWNGVDASGNLIGFDIDLANAICERIKYTCRINAQPIEGLIPALEQGKYDLLLTGIGITEERKKRIDYTQSYANLPINFAALKSSPLAALKTWAEMKPALSGRTIGVQSGSSSQKFLDTELKGSITVRLYDNQDSLNLDLLAERIDAAIAGRSPWIALTKTPQGQAVQVVGPNLDFDNFPYLGEGVGGGMRKDNPDLRKKVDAAICTLKTDGTLKKIAVKWFGFDVTTSINPAVCGA